MVKAQETIDLNSVKPLNDIADNTNQHFWFWDTIPAGKDPSVGTGAHISEVPESEFNDPNSPNYHSGGNLLARSNGIAVRDGLTELAVFGADGARVGANGGANVIIEDVQTLFHGNNGELVGAINSGAVISGSFTEDVNNVIGIVTSDVQLPWTIASGRLAYPPNGDITFSWESPYSYKENYVVHRSDWFSKTIDSTQDCDVTEDGVRIVYNASTRRYELTYVSIYPVAYVVTNKYYSSWPNPVVDGTHLSVTNTQRLNNRQVVTLLLDPVAGDPINMSLYDATYNTSLSLWFDAGTAETKTVTYPNYPQYSATASYDGNKTITITNSRNYALTISISYDVLLGYVGDFKITYDREFLAPR